MDAGVVLSRRSRFFSAARAITLTCAAQPPGGPEGVDVLDVGEACKRSRVPHGEVTRDAQLKHDFYDVYTNSDGVARPTQYRVSSTEGSPLNFSSTVNPGRYYIIPSINTSTSTSIKMFPQSGRFRGE